MYSPILNKFYLFSILLLFAACQNKSKIQLTPGGIDLANVNVIADGNSYMEGYGVKKPSCEILMKLEPFASSSSTMVNFAVGGQSTTQMLADQSSQVYPAFKPDVVNILLNQEGGNDIYYGKTSNEALANTKAYCRKAKKYAINNNLELYVIIYSLIPRNQPSEKGSLNSFNIAMQDYNRLILADTSGDWDKIVNLQDTILFSSYTAGGYHADQIHPGDKGQAAIAELTKAKVVSLKKRN